MVIRVEVFREQSTIERGFPATAVHPMTFVIFGAAYETKGSGVLNCELLCTNTNCP